MVRLNRGLWQVATPEIVVVGQGELSLVAELYNQVFIPRRDQDFFSPRLTGKNNSLILIANVQERPVGFSIGYELRPSTWFNWLLAVLADYRRAGIATQLLEAEQAWARDHNYHLLRIECRNRHRSMLHLALAMDYDIMGTRWDPELNDNLVIFEKNLDT